MKCEADRIFLKEQLELAKVVAQEAHKGQFRKDGVTPYITHPEAVANLVGSRDDVEDKCVAWLHDVLEDTELDFKALLEKGVYHKIARRVLNLSRFQGENYFDYIHRVKGDSVKIADISHNIFTLYGVPEKDRKSMLKRYSKALQILAGVREQEMEYC